ncbi:MAG TPA: polymer-forming cytoskeletal protein [Polyangia bacterium]
MADRDSENSGPTVIGPLTRVSGELRGGDDVLVQGRIDGRVTLTSTLTIEDGAIVQADIEARIVLVSGVVVGNINATEELRLSPRARVVGDLTAPRVIMEAGAAFRGRLDMGDIQAGAAASRASARRPVEREGNNAVKAAPPKIAAPARIAQTPGSVARAGAAPARAATPAATAARAPAPPALPRPGVVGAGGVASGGAAWAKKKLQRRR